MHPSAVKRSTAALLLLLLLLLVAATLLTTAAAAGDASGSVDEVAIMRRLHKLLHDGHTPYLGRHAGWAQRDNPTPPCQWENVKCRDGRVVHILVAGGPYTEDMQPSIVPLLPELALLPALEELRVEVTGHRIGVAKGLDLQDWQVSRVAGIPPEWGHPGAFPRLQVLKLSTASLEGALPDLQPGALPQLRSLNLDIINACSGRQDEGCMPRVQALPLQLPASWGTPGVLPALASLTINLQGFLGPLPAAWARGFPSLTRLSISGNRWVNNPRSSNASGSSAAGGALPPEWGAGLSLVTRIDLSGLGLSGPFPEAWTRGLTALNELILNDNTLTSTLPAQLTRHHPNLTRLEVDNNRFGAQRLPDEWGESALEYLGLGGNPLLEGPAFPPAWLEPGRMSSLRFLRLSNNGRLGGALPANLSWPVLEELDLDGTAVTGTVPESWCRAPFAGRMTYLWADFNSSIASGLPACAARYMPQLRLHVRQSVPQHWLETHAPHTAPEQARHHLATAVLAAIAVVVGAVAGSFVWRRRRLSAAQQLEQRRQSGSPQQQGLLQPSDSAAAAGEDACANPAAPGLRHRPRRQLEVELRAMLSHRSMRLPALPVNDLPRALAHQMPPGAAPVPDSWQAADDSGEWQERMQLLTGLSSGPSKGWDVEAAGRGSPPVSRSWGLETQSLRVAVTDLEFVSDEDGMLVELGEGAHGVVYLARLQGTEVAVKVFQLPRGIDSAQAWREVALLKACAHPRVCAIYAVAVKGDLLMLAMEHFQLGSLRAALQSPQLRRQLRWAERGRQVALDVAEALAFLASIGVMHADVKAGNVLLNGSLRAALGDLGVARALAVSTGGAVGFCCTHASPEQLMGQRCGVAADMYSFGVLLIELTTQRLVDRRGAWTLPKAGVDCPAGVVQLIEDCLVADPTSRPTAAEALQRLREMAEEEGAGAAGAAPG